jgi:hypothetical protein
MERVRPVRLLCGWLLRGLPVGDLEPLANLGLSGAIIIVLVVQVRFLQGKLVEVIESNTRAMVELKAVIDKCQIMHREG